MICSLLLPHCPKPPSSPPSLVSPRLLFFFSSSSSSPLVAYLFIPPPPYNYALSPPHSTLVQTPSLSLQHRTMGLELDVVGEFPSLEPIHTRAGMAAKPLEEELSVSSSNGEAECGTPRSEELEPRPAPVCPPAPRKPRSVKRKLGPPLKGYCPVPADLASVFVPLSCLASKKIRVG